MESWIYKKWKIEKLEMEGIIERLKVGKLEMGRTEESLKFGDRREMESWKYERNG